MKPKAPVDLAQAVVEAAATSERVNQFLLEHLDESLWREKVPAGRTIAAIFAHIHNVRHLWLTTVARNADLLIPAKVDPKTIDLAGARAALAESGAAIGVALEMALAAGGRVRDFKPDAIGFLAYLVSHEAHHRGQVLLLARLLGKPVPEEAALGMWNWSRRWQECDFNR